MNSKPARNSQSDLIEPQKGLPGDIEDRIVMQKTVLMWVVQGGKRYLELG